MFIYYNDERKILKPSLVRMACHVMQYANTRSCISIDKRQAYRAEGLPV
jgi:hypothetical protein